MASEDKDNASLASRCTCTVLPVAGSLMKHHYSELSNQLNELCSCSSRKQQIICEIEEAQSPLVTLPTRSRSDSFARILSYRVGIKDLTMGAKLVQNAGDEDVIDSEDRGTVVHENRHLRREKKELEEKNDSFTQEKKLGKRRARVDRWLDDAYAGGRETYAKCDTLLPVFESHGKKPIGTSKLWPALGAKMSRLSLDLQLFDVDQSHKVPSWHSVSPVPENGVYLNRVVSINIGIAIASHHGNKLYSTDDQVTEWKTWLVDDDAIITSLASLNGECYSVMQQQMPFSSKIARFDARTGMWHPCLTFKGKLQLAANENELLLIGLDKGEVDDKMQICKFDIIGGMLDRVCSVPINPLQFSAIAVGDTIYMTGTHDDWSSFTCSLNLSDFSINNLPNTTNRNCTLLNFGGRLVASGGIDDSEKTTISAASNHVEIFQQCVDQWLPLPPMVHKRVCHGVCVTNEYSIAVVGGVDLDTLSSVEIFQL